MTDSPPKKLSVPWDVHRPRAEHLVNANATKYPELLVEQLARAMYDQSKDAARATFCTEMAIVALRMLERAGKLKPTTDDERAAAELAGYMIDLPAANRRLIHPAAESYVETAVEYGQQLIFDTTSQESVEAEAA